MKKKIFTVLFVLIFFLSFNSQQILDPINESRAFEPKLQRIESYSLGEVYETIKDDNFLNFKLKCNTWVNNVKYQYAVQLLNDSRNKNTLIEKINNENIKSDYEELLSNIQKIGNRVGFYSTSESECPLIKYKFVKTIFDFYEKISKIYSELDNLQTDKINAIIDFDEKVEQENLNLVVAKQLENSEKKDDLDNQYNKILRESGLENQLKGINNKIQSLKDHLQQSINSIEIETKGRIKKLPISNFSANKQKIILETENKKNNLKSNTEKQILALKKENKDKIAKLEDTYGETLMNIKKQKEELENFDYEKIKIHSKFDDSEYVSQQETKIKELEETINKFNENIRIIENQKNSGSKVIKLL